METKDEFMKNAESEIGEQDFSGMYASLDNEYYEMVERHVKGGNSISKEVYEGLSEGQRFHFNKHYNHRNDKVVG